MAQDVLAGRHALVTGGAQGLGAGMAKALAEAGAQVMIGDLQDVDAEIAERDRRRGHAPRRHRRGALGGRVAATVEQLGGLDILVNNAGIEISAPDRRRRGRRPPEDARGQRPRHGARHQARAARDAPRRARRARAARSSTSRRSRRRSRSPGIAGYSATKSAVDRLTRVAAFEAGKLGFGVRVNCVYPGLVPTAMGQKLAVDMAELGLFESPEAAVGAVVEQTPLGRLGEVADMADAVVFLASDAGALHHRHRPAGRRRDGDVATDVLARRLPGQGRVARARRAVPGRGTADAHLRRGAGPELGGRRGARAPRASSPATRSGSCPPTTRARSRACSGSRAAGRSGARSTRATRPPRTARCSSCSTATA